jgi:small subunit ribosomal protein S6
MALYETVLIARQEISAAQAEGLAETFTNLLKEQGGEVKKTEYWGLRTLSYKIKKNRKGHYLLLNIDAPAPAVAEMERNIRLNEDVLRFQTLRVDTLEEGPSVVMQNRGNREGRDGERGGRREFGDRGGDRGDRGGDRGYRPRRTEAAPAAEGEEA